MAYEDPEVLTEEEATELSKAPPESSSHWNHRVIETVYPSGERSWSIHEVYYSSSGLPEMYTEDPVDVSTFSELGGPSTGDEALVSLRQQLEWMLKALSKPILLASDFKARSSES